MIINEKSLMDKLEQIEIDEKIYELQFNKQDQLTIKYKEDHSELYIHSKYDPMKQAEQFANGNYTENTVIVMFGLGIGYHVAAMLSLMTEQQKLFVIEANLAIVKIAFEHTDVKCFLEDEKVVFFASEDYQELTGYLKEALGNDDLHFIVYDPSLRTIPKPLGRLYDILAAYKTGVRSIHYEKDYFADNHEYNVKMNYQNAGELFYNKCKDVPIIIVAGGVSLSGSVEALKKAKGKAIVIAVARTGAILDEMDCPPDFYLASDCMGSSEYHTRFIKKHKKPLILLSTASKYCGNYEGEKLILFEKSYLEEENKKYGVTGGGSVATIALSLAKLMGGNPITFVAQDLCYTTDVTHTNFNGKKYKKIASGRYVMGTDGNEYYTSQPLYLFLRWIERFIEQNPHIQFINCTSKGAKIEGTEQMELEKFLESLSPIQ